jgi:hypothetical protein
MYVYHDDSGGVHRFDPAACENHDEFFRNYMPRPQTPALISRTPNGKWLAAKIIGPGSTSYGKAPLWELFRLKWTLIGLKGAVDLYDAYRIDYPASLVADIERAEPPDAEPDPNTERDRFFYTERIKPKPANLGDRAILAKAKRLHPDWDCDFGINTMRDKADKYAAENSLPRIKRRPYKRR